MDWNQGQKTYQQTERLLKKEFNINFGMPGYFWYKLNSLIENNPEKTLKANVESALWYSVDCGELAKNTDDFTKPYFGEYFVPEK